jgi:hypothetical protein
MTADGSVLDGVTLSVFVEVTFTAVAAVTETIDALTDGGRRGTVPGASGGLPTNLTAAPPVVVGENGN